MTAGPLDGSVELPAKPVVTDIPRNKELLQPSLFIASLGGFVIFQQYAAQDGGQSKADKERYDRCGHHHPGKGPHHCPDTGGHHDHHRHKHHHIGQSTGRNRSNDLAGTLFGSCFNIFVAVQVVEDIFDNHDTVGHQHPHRTAQTQEGHDVKGVPQPDHCRKSHHHRNRHGDHHNKSTADIVQKEEEQHSSQDDTRNNGAFGIIHRRLNKLPGILEPDHFHTRGQFAVAFHLFHPLADAFDNLNSVGFGFFDHIEKRRRFAVDICFIADFPAHKFDFGNIPHVNTLVLDSTDFQRPDLFKVFVVAGKGHIFLVFIYLDTPQRFTHIVGFELIYNSADGKVHGSKFGTVKQNVYLHFIGAVDPHFAYAGNSGKLVGNNIVSKVVKVFLGAVAHQKNLHN